MSNTVCILLEKEKFTAAMQKFFVKSIYLEYVKLFLYSKKFIFTKFWRKIPFSLCTY